MYPISNPQNTPQSEVNIPTWTLENEDTRLSNFQRTLKQKYYIGLSLIKTCFPRTSNLVVGSIVGAKVGSFSLPLALPAATITGALTTIGTHTLNALREHPSSRVTGGIISAIYCSTLYNIVHNDNVLKKLCLEPFSQIKGDFYRTLCHFPIDNKNQANIGICHALSLLWIREMVINQNDPKAMKETLQKLKTINLSPPNKFDAITLTKELKNSECPLLIPLSRAFPECRLNSSTMTFSMEENTYKLLPSWEKPEKNPATFGYRLVKSLVESETSYKTKYANITFMGVTTYTDIDHSVSICVEKQPINKGGEGEQTENNNPVIIHYFDPNFGQFQLKTSSSEAPQAFSEFFQHITDITFRSKGYYCDTIFTPYSNAHNRIPENALRLTS